jgi:putative membrane protein
VATLVGLIITSLLSDGLSISGGVTWIAATVIVWLVSLLGVFVLPLIFVKKKVEERRA